jgi:hypothetical protein
MSYAWHAVAPEALAGWNARLLASDASFAQYPYWNESMRSWRLRVTHLACGPPDDPLAFASILELGLLRVRIGVVHGGPVFLRALDAEAIGRCLQALAAALRDRGFVLACFAGPDAGLLEQLAAVGPSSREPLLPFAVSETEALLVPQAESDEATAATFAPVARRDIRRAEREGFTIESSVAPEAVDAAWPIWQGVHRLRGYARSRASWRRLLDLGRELGLACIYTARLGERPVQAILVVRTRTRAHYLHGALDREALGERPSPSCLLHFRAMRDCFARGCTVYDLGSRSGPVYRFKRKFRPQEQPFEPPVNLILAPALYPLCRWLLPRLP